MANTGTKPLDWKGQTVLFSQSTNQLGTNMSESILKPRWDQIFGQYIYVQVGNMFPLKFYLRVGLL